MLRVTVCIENSQTEEMKSTMKIIRATAFLTFLLALAVGCAAQEPQASPTPVEFPTKIESLMSETGAVIVKGYTRVGSVTGSRGTAYVTAWEVTDATAGHREMGVEVEVADPAARPDADACLLSCANIAALGIIDALERRLERPVVTSNQAVLWDVLMRLGRCSAGPGRLFAAARRPAQRSLAS